MKPLAIDLYCGLGGWAEGFLAEGYDVIGFDIERHNYGAGGYPGQLVLQDALTLHGSQFRDAAWIVASPPCQAYSYRAMPWKRAKALPPPSNALFDACFRIQAEACEAAGRHIPMVVENVKGAQPWVGRAKAHYGSYYLWGDVEDVGGRIVASGKLRFGMPSVKAATRKVNSAYAEHGSWKNEDGEDWRSPRNVGLKVDGPVTGEGQKVLAYSDPRRNGGNGVHLTSPRENSDGVKIGGSGDAYWREPLQAKRREATAIKNGKDRFGFGENCSLQRRASSKSDSRKAASAMIAKIPFELSRHIAAIYKP